MTNITLSVPEEVHREMVHFSEIKWSTVARKAIIEKLELLRLTEKLAAKSKLTKKDVDAFSKMINARATRNFLK